MTVMLDILFVSLQIICFHLQFVHLEYKLYKVLENSGEARKGSYILKKAFINVGPYEFFIDP